jgi:hypothetical protein
VRIVCYNSLVCDNLMVWWCGGGRIVCYNGLVGDSVMVWWCGGVRIVLQ